MKRMIQSFVRVAQEPLPAFPVAEELLPGGIPVAPEDLLPEGEPQPASPAAQAVFVVHGMGQQLPFETLDAVASALRAAHLRAGADAPEVIVRQVQRGKERMARAETTVHTATGERPVHLYEAYWAPLTEGQITLRETFAFLLRAGVAGAQRSWAGSWWRMMFGRKQEFALSKRTFLAFILALSLLVLVGVMNGIIVAATASQLLTGNTRGWPGGNLLADLTIDFGLCLVLTVLLYFMGIWWVGRRRRIQSDGHVVGPSRSWVVFGWLCVWSMVGVVLAVGLLVLVHLGLHHGGTAPRMWTGPWADIFVGGLSQPEAPRLQVLFVILVWGGIALASWLARGFLLQYVGDVAIYISSHTVNRFCVTRQAIQDATNRVLRFVFAEPDAPRLGLLYEQVIVVGHSLGSVIAYDALNALIREDITARARLRVLDRTSLFLTSGSPLDKTAFIFRAQARRESDVREALAESMQPMISDYATRPGKWINLWSPNDWICGSLEYYDDGSRPADPHHIENRVDRQATTPLMAHNQYWDGELFGDTLFEALGGVSTQSPAGIAGAVAEGGRASGTSSSSRSSG